MEYDFVTILGPTATGKTEIAVQLASEFNAEIISADSRQVYRGMDIGTGKDLQEYENRNVNFHLIDIVDPTDEYNLFRFRNDFINAHREVKNRNKLPFLVGGTGMYLSSILQNYHLPEVDHSEKAFESLRTLPVEKLKEILINMGPELHNITDLVHKERIITAILVEKAHQKSENVDKKITSLNIGIKSDREEIKRRITKRLKKRFNEGMIEEVKKLLSSGVTHDKLKFFGLEYKYISFYLEEQIDYEQMFLELNRAIHKFAKRQMTWFRKMEKEGVQINWFEAMDYTKVKNFVTQKLSNNVILS
ncbi:MAG: tRNA (adenosine(37)-N6)-dimethylallyltransferase MiaA [Ignavibacteria bacterium]|nr:tRNA (adenosine(37)-N6)-dimethylallyltransferase MiaA [Ignavibacteria bacterium]